MITTSTATPIEAYYALQEGVQAALEGIPTPIYGILKDKWVKALFCLRLLQNI